MYGSFQSSQYVELIHSSDESREVEFQISLVCITRGKPAQLYGPPENCYEAEGPEFDIVKVDIIDDEGNSTQIFEGVLFALCGEDIVNRMFENAEVEAMETGEF